MVADKGGSIIEAKGSPSGGAVERSETEGFGSPSGGAVERSETEGVHAAVKTMGGGSCTAVRRKAGERNGYSLWPPFASLRSAPPPEGEALVLPSAGENLKVILRYHKFTCGSIHKTALLPEKRNFNSLLINPFSAGSRRRGGSSGACPGFSGRIRWRSWDRS